MSKKRSFIIMDWLRKTVNKVFPEVLPNNYLYSDMDDAIEKWLSVYYDSPKWLKQTHGRSLNLGASIASEFARLIMIEFDVEITGDKRAEYLNTQFTKLKNHLRINLEEACAVGGMVFKPYVRNGVILPDFITQEKFIPLTFNADEITSAAFVNLYQQGTSRYCRIEKQTYNYDTRSHCVESKFFTVNGNNLGKKVDAKKISPNFDTYYEIHDVDKPLFAFWRVPMANTIEKDSPLGVSVYSRSVKNIMEADFQWDRFLWEFEGGELAVDACEELLRVRKQINNNGEEENRYCTPSTRDRLFRRLQGEENAFYKVFAPTLRDTSYANGLDKILRKIEFECALGYGTLSDPQNVDKTAEEVKNSKQRSFAVVENMQKSLQTTLENYIYALDQYTSACNLAPSGDYEIKFNWGDGVLEDNEKEQAIKLQEVNSNIITKVHYLMWRYGVTESQAKEMLPKKGKTGFFNEGGGT